MTKRPFTKATQQDIQWTGLQGYITTDYKTLVKKLGKPHITGGDKTTVEWQIKFANGVVATIYDWKNDKLPTGVYRWHIGGHSQKAVELVNKLVRG